MYASDVSSAPDVEAAAARLREEGIEARAGGHDPDRLSASDWVERRSWEAYFDAYDDALRACSTDHAPWYVIPADRKWFRNLAIAEALVEVLRPFRDDWLRALAQRGKEELEAIRAARAADGVRSSPS